GPVAGTLSLSADAQTLTFTPSALLAVNSTYTVNVSGLKDRAGNVMTPFTSGFNTGAAAAPDTVAPLVTAINPVNNAANVPVNTNIIVMFNETINPATVNGDTVSVTINSASVAVGGNYTVN